MMSKKMKFTVLPCLMVVLTLLAASPLVKADTRCVCSFSYRGLRVEIYAPYQSYAGENVTISVRTNASKRLYAVNVALWIKGSKEYGYGNWSIHIKVLDNVKLCRGNFTEKSYEVYIPSDADSGLVYGFLECKWKLLPCCIRRSYAAAFNLLYLRNLLDGYNELKAKYDALTEKFDELSENHTRLKEDYNELMERYDKLFMNYTEIKAEYNELENKYGELETDYAQLNATYQTLFGEYDALKAKYDEALADYDDLKIKYDKLLANYTKIKDDYEKILLQYNELLINYTNTKENYEELQEDYDSLLYDYNIIQGDYKKLQEDCDSLQEQYESLNSTYYTLQHNYDLLLEDYENLESEHKKRVVDMNNARNLNYVLAVVTAIFLAATVYSVRRKRKPA